MEYKSDRLLLREYAPDEFPQFYSIFSNPDIMRHAWIDPYSSEAAARLHFDKILATAGDPPETRSYFELAVLQEDGAFAGCGHIETQIRNEWGGVGEIGYFLLPSFWGKGYATEIARALCALCFGPLGLHRVWARCSAQNSASEGVMRKLGMTREGCARASRFKGGRWDDEPYYALLREDWTRNP